MFKLLLALHVLAAVFAVGPLVHAATTAVRGLRAGDAAAAALSARTVQRYTFVSGAVVVLGFALMSTDSPFRPGKVAEIGDLWIWLSLVLWAVAAGLALGVLAPALEKAASALTGGGSADSARGAVAASGGVIALLYAVIVVLMVYRPGH